MHPCFAFFFQQVASLQRFARAAVAAGASDPDKPRSSIPNERTTPMPARLCLVVYVLSALTASEAFGGCQMRSGPVAPRLLRPASVPCFVTTRRLPAVFAPTMKLAEAEDAIAEAGDAATREMQTALAQTGALVALALCFCAGVFGVQGPEAAGSWLAAYVLELSLSVDNLLVFTLIFDYFKTPIDAQQRVLRWGLIVAAVLRAAFIFAGLAMVESFKPVLLVFAALLVYSSAKMMMVEEEDEDLSDNQIIKLTKKYLPSTDVYDGDRFVTSAAVDGAAEDGGGTLLGLLKGTSVVTPLLVALVCVEISDVVFAVDSIPAVFGVTKDPFIAFTSNAFAILGLRALYTIVAQMVDQFEYLGKSVALVLGFVGGKLVAEYFGVEVSTMVSLAVVFSTLGAGIGASILLKPEDDQTEETRKSLKDLYAKNGQGDEE